MDKRIAGLLGAAAALTTVTAANAAVQTEGNAPAASYRDLLDPVPNAVVALKADDARLAQTPADSVKDDGLQVAQYYHHHHHHHHHHTWCRVRYAACCVGIIITTTIITTTIERHGAGSGIEAGSGDGPRLRLGLPLAGLRGAQQVAIGAVEHRIGIRRPR